ncbi:unnamed protein product [Ectocarpus sp. 12 AP-2014]
MGGRLLLPWYKRLLLDAAVAATVCWKRPRRNQERRAAKGREGRESSDNLPGTQAWQKEKATSDDNNNTSGTQDTTEMLRAAEKRAASRRPRVFDRQALVWRHARQK